LNNWKKKNWVDRKREYELLKSLAKLTGYTPLMKGDEKTRTCQIREKFRRVQLQRGKNENQDFTMRGQ